MLKKISAQVLATGLIFVLAFCVVSIAKVAKAENNNNSHGNKVRICHRTDDVNHPYNSILVNQSAVDGIGQKDHTHHEGPVASSQAVAQALKDNHEKWGDIILPHPGNSLNWTTAGQAIWYNGCNIPGEPTPSPTPSESPSPTISPQILGTSTASGNLPTTGGTDSSIYFLIMFVALYFTYYLKKEGWQRIG